MAEITEYRGVEGLVYAEVTKDDDSGYTTGAVKALAGVAEISKTTSSSSEAHYYDNIPAVVIQSSGSDEITCSVSAIPMEVLADITGQQYDSALGVMIEGQAVQKYFALGYKTKKTNGDEVYVWRYKGTFGIPDLTSATEDDGTTANGQSLVFTGIATTFKFTKGGNVKALNVDVAEDKVVVTNFFDTVTTPDNLVAKP